jgi:hypothetical protein
MVSETNPYGRILFVHIHIHIYSSLHKSFMGFNPLDVEFVIHMYSTFT